MIGKNLDVEWIELIVEVKSLGIQIWEVQEFLRATVKDFNSVDKDHEEDSLNEAD
ncbi:anti-repressor SinI family protein [Peribacillus sp. NPDC097264]|uniref:anti-repressor SinI family protein n=1 Tax=Peribacillus sp. NPDC097264 TaxID=3390616 RepID=UPI003CFC48F8